MITKYWRPVGIFAGQLKAKGPHRQGNDSGAKINYTELSWGEFKVSVMENSWFWNMNSKDK